MGCVNVPFVWWNGGQEYCGSVNNRNGRVSAFSPGFPFSQKLSQAFMYIQDQSLPTPTSSFWRYVLYVLRKQKVHIISHKPNQKGSVGTIRYVSLEFWAIWAELIISCQQLATLNQPFLMVGSILLCYAALIQRTAFWFISTTKYLLS